MEEDNHSHKNEWCELCDSAYSTYVCMFQGEEPSDAQSE